MKSKSIFVTIVFSIALSLIFTSCKKSDRDEDNDLSAAKDNVAAEVAFAGVFKSIIEAQDSVWQIRSSSCAIYTIIPADTFTFPKTLTIDFGTSNCLCSDGNNRRGKIIAAFSGKYRDSLSTITVSLQNYYHNDNHLQAGTYMITNKGRNATGHIIYSVNVQNTAINTSSGGISFDCIHNYEWISGNTTALNTLDDVYSITGTSTGRGIAGNTFSSSINSPLIIAMNCAYIQKGALTLSPANLSPRTVDFGNGSCDSQGTITINGKSYDFNF